MRGVGGAVRDVECVVGFLAWYGLSVVLCVAAILNGACCGYHCVAYEGPQPLAVKRPKLRLEAFACFERNTFVSQDRRSPANTECAYPRFVRTVR